MPPLPADFSHTRVCKPFCEKSLTLPKIGQHNMQVSTLGQTVGAGCFHQAVDHCTGPGSFYRVTEQPVFASHSKGMGGVLGKVIENLTLRSEEHTSELQSRF